MLAQQLFDIQAVQLRPQQPFTWASGIVSPIYCDNRLILGHPTLRKQVVSAFVDKIKEKFPQVEAILGTATAGIPHAALIADVMALPMGYVRGKAKGHGKGNQIEGIVPNGQKVVVIEDLISTGGSSLECVEVLQAAGCEVLGVVAIFSYQLPIATKRFEAAQIPLYTLTHYDELLEATEGNFNAAEAQLLRTWRNQL